MRTEAMRTAAGAISSAGVYLTGQAAVEHDLDPVFAEDLKVGKLYVAIDRALLVFVFGTLAFPAPLPGRAGGDSPRRSGSSGSSPFMELTAYIQNMVMLIGLGIAVDYSRSSSCTGTAKSSRAPGRRRLPPGEPGSGVPGTRGVGGTGRDRAHDGDRRPGSRLQRHRRGYRARPPALHAAAVHARVRDRRPADPDRLGRVRSDAVARVASLPRHPARPRPARASACRRAPPGRGARLPGHGSRARSCAAPCPSQWVHPRPCCCSQPRCSNFEVGPGTNQGIPEELEAVRGLRDARARGRAGGARPDRPRRRRQCSWACENPAVENSLASLTTSPRPIRRWPGSNGARGRASSTGRGEPARAGGGQE